MLLTLSTIATMMKVCGCGCVDMCVVHLTHSVTPPVWSFDGLTMRAYTGTPIHRQLLLTTLLTPDFSRTLCASPPLLPPSPHFLGLFSLSLLLAIFFVPLGRLALVRFPDSPPAT